MDELRVDLGQRSYPIFIDQNLFPIAGQLLKGILTAGKIMVITNPTVGQLYLNDLVEGLRQGGFEVFSAEVPDGEQYKTLDSASGLYDSLLDHQMDRGSTIVALGGLLFPALVKDGYSEKFSLGLVTGSGCIGLLFPPSIPVILYGIVARVEIDQIFLAGLIPGLMILLVFSSYGGFMSVRQKIPRGRFSFSEAITASRACLWEMPLPVIIIGGIYGGLATVTEVAALTVAYAFLVEVVIYRDIKWSELSRVCMESGKMVGAILLILCMALSFANFIILYDIPEMVVEIMGEIISDQLSFISPKIAFLILLNLMLLVVGCFLDIFSAILVVVPLILPIAKEFGVHPLHLAIIFLVNLEIGYLTPPVGLNLFISSFRFRKSMVSVYAATLSFLLLLVGVLIIITYFEPLSLLFHRAG